MLLEGFSDCSGLLKSGVYALCCKGVVVYVGKSKTMLARVYTHRNVWIQKRKGKKMPFTPVVGIHFDEVLVYPVPVDRLDAVEEEMINRYKPKYNQQLKTQEKVLTPFTLNIGGLVLQANPPSVKESIQRRI